jgi:hypothetical protein
LAHEVVFLARELRQIQVALLLGCLKIMKLDLFTRRRLQKAIKETRVKTGELPTRKDLLQQGFTEETIESGIRSKTIEEFYVTLTSGTIVKAFKVIDES